jgi:hypothetical protein
MPVGMPLHAFGKEVGKESIEGKAGVKRLL